MTAAGRTVTAAGRTVTAAGRTVTAAGRTVTAAGRTVTAAGRTAVERHRLQKDIWAVLPEQDTQIGEEVLTMSMIYGTCKKY